MPRFLAVAAILALGLAPAAAQSQTGGIEGNVVDASGASLSKATVALSLLGAAGPSTDTGVAGDFRFSGLAPGFYTLKVSLEGFRPLTREVSVAPDTTAAV